MKKKICSLLLCAGLLLTMTACGGAPAAENTYTAGESAEKDSYTVGVCQLVQHEALDAATQGFVDTLQELLGDRVDIQVKNASGDSATCAVICSQFVSDGADLIMANATAALQAAASATNQIPILGTSITDYGSALNMDNWTGVSGTNISGTSDLAPLDGQAQIIKELFPDAKNVGILFCSGEANSKFQADTIAPMIEELGFAVKTFTFADSNDVASVTGNACGECDVLYIPTDNTAASCAETIHNVAQNAGIPIVCGEENLCRGCGAATLSISYYDIGCATARMAYEILEKGADISNMEVQFAPEFTKEFNEDICSALGIEVPEGFAAIPKA